MIFIDIEGLAYDVLASTLWVIAGIFSAIAVIFYLLRSFALYKMAKKRSLKKAYFAFIPFLWVYTAGVLAGEVNFFGRRFSKFALVAVIIFTVAEGLGLIMNLFLYIPVLGYYFQGGQVLVSTTLDFFPEGTWIFSPTGVLSGLYIATPFIKLPYSDAFLNVYEIINYVQLAAGLASLVFLIVLYINLFKGYLPTHYLIASIFSVIGLFAPFVFAVRNNDRVNYGQYMRSRYAAFYNIPGAPYGGNPNGNAQNGMNTGSGEDANPFEEFGGKKSADKNDDDPFDEFNDNNDDKDVK